ncbi:hypothetical protein ZYGR_0AK00540 [Zygosaccharomyces rouxii]|uniref:Uncharacterized protein n=1 Tax=Zygosaccharomyces rouxii TaxID=4956 RepID=A0A1Q3ACZ1_ZYGRO|nr:hypothetical protein ZYGR_0AK00540 [Zygosaccharomyces rouxii]
MVFSNASDLDRVRLDSWFNAGGLEVSKEATYRDTLDRTWFEYEKKICSRKPLRCLPTFVPDDSKEHWNQLLYIKSMTTGASATTFAPRRELEEIFGIARDPESLEDSDIDDFLGNSQKIDSRHKFDERIIDIPLHREYLLVSPSSVFKAGHSQQTLLDGGIVDCQVVNTLPGKLGSILLITTPAGYILSMLLDLEGNKPIILQYWKLRQNSGNWNIVKHQSDEQFVVVNKEKGICKFFEFRDPLHFTLVNNLSIDNAKFLTCSFFLNMSNSHYLFFVPSIRYHRMVLFCIEWDSNRPEVKEVHQLTYLNGSKVNYCVPVGHNVCLVSGGCQHYLVSAHQIMSGETSFQHFESKFLEGPCSYFDAPILLEKIKNCNEDLFDQFRKCTVLATISGNIGICLWDENGEVAFYSFTRFKGLKDICPVNYQETVDNEYEIVVISFGRTLRLTLDIRSLQQLSAHTMISPLNGVLFKHTMDSSTEENSELMVLSPPKNNSRFPVELWLTSSMAISHLQTFAPVRKLHGLCKLRQFQVFNTIKVFNCSNFNDNLKETLLQGMEIGNDSEVYLIIASDLISMSKAFLLNATSSESNTMELEDLLHSVAGDNVEVFFSPGANMIQITKDTVYVDSLGSPGEEKIEKYSPGWEIDGAAYCGSRVIIWNIDQLKISYINDIDELNGATNFIESSFFEEILRCAKEEHEINLDQESEKDKGGGSAFFFNFDIAQLENGTVIVYLAYPVGLVKYSWEDLYLNSDSEDTGRLMTCTRDVAFLPLKNHVYVKDAHGQLIGAEHTNSSFRIIEVGYTKRDIQIRPFDHNAVIIFSPQEITIVSMSSSENGDGDKFHELKLPFQSKANPILDVSVDPESNKVFVLYADGLEVFELIYSTWNGSNYLLKSTKTLKRIFFIEKINRMLVVNLRAKEWDCIKLADGKSLSLDAAVLKTPKNSKLVDAIEIPSGKEDKNVHLLLHFGNLLKLVRLVPQKGRITVEEVTQREFSSELFHRIEVVENGNFIVYVASSVPSSGQKPISQFMLMRITELGQLEEITKLEFPDELHLQEFKLCGKDVAVVSKHYDRIFLFKDFFRLAALKRPMAIAIKMPAASKVEKICPIGTDSFVVAVRCEGRSDHLSELLFCHRNDICLNRESDPDSSKGDVLYDAAVVDDIQRREEGDFYRIELEDDDDDLDDEDDEADEDDDSGGGIGIRLGRRSSNWDGNYRDFLDRIINGPRTVSTEGWEFDDIDMEYEAGEHEENHRESDSDEDMLDTDDMDEMDETDAFGRRSDYNFPFNTESVQTTGSEVLGYPFASSDLVESISSSRFRRPYQVINLDKSIQDVKYSPKNNKLFVLTTDGSVLIFRHFFQNLQEDHKNIGDGVVNILKKTITRHVAPKITESGICTVDDEGQVKEWPWL